MIQRPNYTVTIRTSVASYQTVAIDSLSSVQDRARQLALKLLKKGELTLEEYQHQMGQVRDLIDGARSIRSEQQLKSNEKFDALFNDFKDRVKFLR